MPLSPCPTCRTPTPWQDNPWKPFCSERCKVRDLGAWSAESYRIPTAPEHGEEEAWNPAEDGAD